MSKLHDFAQAVGADIKEIKTALAGKAEKGEVTANGITQDLLKSLILLKSLLIKLPLVVVMLILVLLLNSQNLVIVSQLLKLKIW